MTKANKKLRYRDLSAKLQAEIDWFDQQNLDIDEALLHYKRAEELIEQMKIYLEVTKKEFDRKKPSSKK